MAKDANALMNELGVTSTTDADTLINKLGSLEIINQTELLGVKSVSVTTLPTVVKNSEADLKSKMINIVTDEDKGSAYLINKRIVLIKKILSNINNRLTNAETNVNEIDVKTKNYIDLGYIEGLPTDINNEALNNVTKNGLYIFTFTPGLAFYNLKETALMQVTTSDEQIIQTIQLRTHRADSLILRDLWINNPANNSIRVDSLMTTNSYQTITSRKAFNDLIFANYEITDTFDSVIVNKKYVDGLVNKNIATLQESKADKTELQAVANRINDLNYYGYSYSTNPYVAKSVLFVDNVAVVDDTLVIRTGSVVDGTLYL